MRGFCSRSGKVEDEGREGERISQNTHFCNGRVVTATQSYWISTQGTPQLFHKYNPTTLVLLPDVPCRGWISAFEVQLYPLVNVIAKWPPAHCALLLTT